MIALYMDENAHGAITQGLLNRDVDVLRVQDDGRIGIPDDQVLLRASELGRVLFSQDDDLLREARKCQVQAVQFSGVVYAHQMEVSIGDCIKDLELLAKAGQIEDFVNQVYYLPL